MDSRHGQLQVLVVPRVRMVLQVGPCAVSNGRSLDFVCFAIRSMDHISALRGNRSRPPNEHNKETDCALVTVFCDSFLRLNIPLSIQ